MFRCLESKRGLFKIFRMEGQDLGLGNTTSYIRDELRVWEDENTVPVISLTGRLSFVLVKKLV